MRWLSGKELAACICYAFRPKCLCKRQELLQPQLGDQRTLDPKGLLANMAQMSRMRFSEKFDHTNMNRVQKSTANNILQPLHVYTWVSTDTYTHTKYSCVWTLIPTPCHQMALEITSAAITTPSGQILFTENILKSGAS